MIERDDGVIVTAFVRLSQPLAQLFALYVLAHGHYSPGGGFQAGVVLAATGVLLALALGREAFEQRLSERTCLAAGAAGVLLYLLTGLAGIAGGAAFLDYAALAVGLAPARARYAGILVVEAGVAIAVAGTLLVIFSRLTDRGRRP